MSEENNNKVQYWQLIDIPRPISIAIVFIRTTAPPLTYTCSCQYCTYMSGWVWPRVTIFIQGLGMRLPWESHRQGNKKQSLVPSCSRGGKHFLSSFTVSMQWIIQWIWLPALYALSFMTYACRMWRIILSGNFFFQNQNGKEMEFHLFLAICVGMLST